MNWTAIIIAVVVLIIIIWFISTKNGFHRMVIKIEEAESGIDVALTKRFDLITKLLDAAKGFMKHEKDLLVEVTKMRTPSKNASIQDKANFTEDLNKISRQVNVAVEAYPQLKSDATVLKLQSAIAEVEAHLQAARRLYNSNVSTFNQSIVVFPGSMVAGGRFTKKNFFEADAAKREDVKIEF